MGYMKKLKYIVFLLVAVVCLGLVQTVRAEPNVNDLFVAEENVNTTQDLDGTAFRAGRNVKINSKVSGILFAAGENVSFEGESDYLFAAGRIVTVEGKVVNDAFVAGSSVSLEEVSVGRDIYVGGENVSLSGDFERNVYAGGSVVLLGGNYKGDVTIEAQKIEIVDGTKIGGKLKYNDTAELKIADGVVIGATETFKGVAPEENDVKEDLMKAKIKSIVFGLVNGLVVGWLMIWLMPYVFEKLVEKNKQFSFSLAAKRFGWGLLWLIVLPILFVVSMVTMVGIGAGMLMIFIYGLLIGLSGILVGYLVGWKLNLVEQNKTKVSKKYVDFAIGYLILTLVRNIPVVGWLVSFLTVAIGLGLGFNLIIDRKKKAAVPAKSK